MFKQSFDHSPSGRPVSAADDPRDRRRHPRRRLPGACAPGNQDALPERIEELVDWALAYQREDSAVLREAIAAARGRPQRRRRGDSAVDWSEPPDSRRSRAELSQRERIVRAAARVVVDRGYETLSIPTISAAAGTSQPDLLRALPQ